MTQSSADIEAYCGSRVPGERRWRTAWIQAVIVAALLVWFYYSILRGVAFRWNSDANWSHGWLVPVFSLYFLYTRREQIARTPTSTCYAGLVVLVLALAAFLYFWAIRPYGYLRLLTLVGAIAGVTLLLAGWVMLRRVWFPILFLLLANPIPDQYYVALTMPLRKLSTCVSAMLLSLIPGIELEVQNVLIDYFHRGKQGALNVEEACAGMRLMMAFMALGVAIAYLGDRPTWQRICMVASCVPIAVFCNIVRVTVSGYLTVYGHAELAQGAAHQLLGLGMLPVALGLFSLTGYILKHLLVEQGPAVTE